MDKKSRFFTNVDINSGKLGSGEFSGKIISGVSTRTQKVDALGKVKHVLMINQSSYGDIKSQKDKGQGTKRSSTGGKKRRRRPRPGSSRLNKRGRNFNLDFINSKASNGEEIATVAGGSTSRQHT